MKLRSLALLGCVVFATSAQADYTKYAPGLVPAGLAVYGFNLEHGTANKKFKPVMITVAITAAAMAARLGMDLKGNALLVARGVEVLTPFATAYYVTTETAKKSLGFDCPNCKCMETCLGAGAVAAALAYYVK